MRHVLIPALLAAVSLAPAMPAFAQNLPQGLQSARFLPGWMDADGQRIAALELVLEPGWKTYWRSPGDAGLAPEFDWKGSNIAEVTFHWPAPEVFELGGMRTLGYHDRLVLPFTVTPELAGQPIGVSAQILFGLCEDICVPAELDLIAPAAGDAPDPAIKAAMTLVPQQGDALPACEIGEIEDGMTVTLSLPEPGAEVVVEHGTDPKIWVSAPEPSADGREVSVDFVAPAGKPFPLGAEAIVMTVLSASGATEYQGCASG